MLYLAEVQKQKTGFIGAAKAEIKLLAFQRADQSWNPVQGEEAVPAEEANNLNAGALVLADLNANRQVQRIQEAGRPLVSILQNFSRLLEKSKNQEAEIEQWKESLKYQSEEISRRQLEMEAQLEQLEQVESNSRQLTVQQQEIERGREKVERLRAELEQKQTELERAWEHLRGEQRRLEEQFSGTSLDEASAQQIQELLTRLSNGVASTQAIYEQVNFCFELVENQQNILGNHWHQLEQQKGSAQQQQEEVDHQSQMQQNSFEEWQQAQNTLKQTQAELQVQTSVLNSKQAYAQMLGQQLQTQEDLYQQIYQVTKADNGINLSQKVDLAALEQMPIEQLQQQVQDLQRDWQNASRFVHEQEEELRYKQQAINELQAKLSQAADHDRTNIEAELAEEQDSYQFLNQTLVGQRQNLRERREILGQHSRVLWRRQGMDTGNGKFDLEPILSQIQHCKQQQIEELQRLEQEIEQLRSSIEQLQETINDHIQVQKTRRQELQDWEQNLLSLRTAVAESWGRVNLYQEMLQPVQDGLDGLRHKLEAIADILSQADNSVEQQFQAIDQIRQKIGVGG